jgi:hypothetical protein
VTLQEQLAATLQHLSPADQERVLAFAVGLQGSLRPRRDLRGAFADLGPGPSDEDIRQVRREMWAKFPRDLPQ